MRASILDGAKRNPEGQRFADAKLLSKPLVHTQKNPQLLLLIRPPGLPLRATFQVVSLAPLGSSASRTKRQRRGGQTTFIHSEANLAWTEVSKSI